jgi:hypothetical protein
MNQGRAIKSWGTREEAQTIGEMDLRDLVSLKIVNLKPKGIFPKLKGLRSMRNIAGEKNKGKKSTIGDGGRALTSGTLQFKERNEERGEKKRRDEKAAKQVKHLELGQCLFPKRSRQWILRKVDVPRVFEGARADSMVSGRRQSLEVVFGQNIMMQ